MRPLEIDEPALEVPRAARRGSHWIEPKLVGEVAYTEFTADGILRHPSFIALREDKPATEVVLEKPEKLSKSAKEEDSCSGCRHFRHQDQQPRPGDLSRGRASPRATSPIITPRSSH